MNEMHNTRLHVSVDIKDREANIQLAKMFAFMTGCEIAVPGEISDAPTIIKNPRKPSKMGATDVPPTPETPAAVTPVPDPPIETPAPPTAQTVPAPPTAQTVPAPPIQKGDLHALVAAHPEKFKEFIETAAANGAPNGGPPPAETPAPPVATTPAPTNVDVDNTGRPWDGRIDSSNQQKTKAGAWQKRKFVSKELRAQVISELMSGAAGTAPTAAPVPPTAPGAAPAPPAPPTAPAGVPAAAAAPAAPPVDPVTINSLPLFMGYLDKHGIDQPTAVAACKEKGVDSIALLGTGSYAPCIPGIVEQLEAQRNAV